MEKLILVRCGSHGNGYRLSEIGKRKMEMITEKLGVFVNSHPIAIFCSPARRARESAQILSLFFKVDYEEHIFLRTDSAGLVENFDKTIELISSRENVGTFIAVTHNCFLSNFPEYFAWKSMKMKLHSKPVDNGQAWVIDPKEKTLIHVK